MRDVCRVIFFEQDTPEGTKSVWDILQLNMPVEEAVQWLRCKKYQDYTGREWTVERGYDFGDGKGAFFPTKNRTTIYPAFPA